MIEMKKDIDDIFKLLEQNNLEPQKINPDEIGFSRTIKFKTPYQSCWIVWWKNISYLSIGDRYGNQIPFYNIELCTYHCNNKICLDFSTDEKHENTISVVIKKLDWQEESDE